MKFKARKSENQEDKTISRLTKKLKIKKGQKLPGVFYSEGYGDLIDICDEIINKKHTQEDCSDNECLFEENINSKKTIDDFPIEDENLTDKEFLKIFQSHKDEKKMKKHQLSSLPNCTELEISTTKRDNNDQNLKKSIKMLLNKLSDRNMIKLLAEFKIIISQNGVNNTFEEFVKTFIEFVIQPSSLADRFSLIYTTFLSIIHFVTGNEIMAAFLNNLMKNYCEYFEKLNNGEITKHCQNTISVICILYYFNNIGYVLISDLIKKLLARFREQDIEMILQILKYCGFDLRKREPTALKEIIIDVHNRCKNAENISLRASFMLEVITAIQHNNPSKVTDYDPSLFDFFKKIKNATLKNEQVEGSCINIQLESLINSNNSGKWWLVGSAYNGPSMVDGQTAWSTNKKNPLNSKGESKWDKDVIKAAKNQRYYDKTRIDIFCTIMTSNDCDNAFARLNSLDLKSKDRDMIIRVIIETCIQELPYNDFYGELIVLFTQYHRTFSSTVHFSIWDQMRKLNDFESYSLDNLGKLLFKLFVNESIKMPIFKILDFDKLIKKESLFYEKLFTDLISNASTSVISKLFSKLSDEKWAKLREDILYFILSHLHDNTKLAQRLKLVTSAARSVDPSFL